MYSNNINEIIVQTLNIYLFHNWVNKLFSQENKVPRKQFKARKVAGSATYKQVTLFIQFVQALNKVRSVSSD